MKDKIVNGMQIFARSIVAPILFLPIVGILLAIVGIISNPSIVGKGSPLINVGGFVGGGLWTFLTNLSLIFCVGIAMGMAKEKKAEAALIAVFSFLFFLGANNAWLNLTGRLIKYKVASDLAGTGQTVLLGFQVIDMGVFLGMILGVTIAFVHNKFCNKEFPEAIAIYGNTKLVFMILIPILLILAIVLSYVWPIVALGIKALTTLINSSGFFGIALYGFLNRFLIPTGLHHLIYTPFLYSDIGGALTVNGKTYLGAYNIFLAQLTDPSIKVFDPSAKYLQFGMVKMFGLAGAALAFYKTAKPENRNTLKAVLIPAVATSVLVGITEPLEFTFLFVSPLLWLVHSVMDGVFEAIAVLFGVRTFGCDGIINFIVYNLPAGISRTRWPIYIGVGLVQLGTYYLVFKTLIEKLKLKTPGREDNEVKLFTKKDYKDKKSKDGKQINGNEEIGLACTIVEALGGKDNIETVDNCFTRLRVKITDLDKLDEATLKTTGASGVIENGNNVQVVYGPKVNGIRNEVDKYLANN
ncbi:MAG: PTS transporter subunit EIIC [Clostridium sp.]|uniref:PTS transporter subunit EIIC n=1 Tax=Clostridium sp. TaxID=1506 RepID=UPI0039EA728F